MCAVQVLLANIRTLNDERHGGLHGERCDECGNRYDERHDDYRDEALGNRNKEVDEFIYMYIYIYIYIHIKITCVYPNS